MEPDSGHSLVSEDNAVLELLKSRTNTHVHIARLHSKVTPELLSQIASHFGTIDQVRVVASAKGREVTYGFVRFQSNAGATCFIRCVHNASIEGVRWKVDWASDQSRPQAATAPAAKLGVVLSTWTAGESPVQVGRKRSRWDMEQPEPPPLELADLIKNQLFVQECLQAAGVRCEFVTREVVCRNQSDHSAHRLFVVCHRSISDEQLKAAFVDRIGDEAEVEYAKILRDQEGNSKGCAFVKFGSALAAFQAISVMNRFVLNGLPLKVMMSDHKELK
eukprot:c19173_g1_i2.p1 GENE.c19173_g1_i2~~c19173_g1_i2.p1  ORF type:complete len:276 (+),score=50.01 c19173_g1_i2:421-1248(+)